MFKVERVPLPDDIDKPSNPNRWPFADCAVSESFFVPENKRNSIGSCIRYQRQRWGRRFISRREGSGFRIYRVAWPGGAEVLEDRGV